MTDKRPCPDHGGAGTKHRCPTCNKEYQRRYYRKNREKVAEQQRHYREENREKVAEQQRRYREENREKNAEYQRRYRQENPEKKAETNRRYHERNREKIAECQRHYYQENRDYIISKTTQRRTAKNRASQHFATNSGKPWTPQEVAKMNRLRRQGLSNYEIAVELGRSLNAVTQKMHYENARN